MESSIPRMVALLVLVSIAEVGAVRGHGGSSHQPTKAGKIMWQYDTSGCVFSTPTVAGDVLLIGSCSGTFYAFEKQTGKVRWSYNIRQDGNQTSFHGNPLITDSSILIGTDNGCAADGMGHVYALDRATGTVRWKYRTVGTPTDIARLGSTIYAASYADELIALNLADGRLLWRFATGASNQDCVLPSAPVVAGEHVFYAGLDGILYGLDGHSGKLLWKHNFGNRVTTNLSVFGTSLYLGNSTRRLFRISAEDGHVESELAVPATPEGRVLVHEPALYLFLEGRDSHTGYLISTDLNLSHVNWMYKADRAWSSEWPQLWNGLLLAGNCHSEMQALRTADGAPQWSDTLKGCLRSIGTDGDSRQIYVGVQEGTVYAYSPPPSPR